MEEAEEAEEGVAVAADSACGTMSWRGVAATMFYRLGG